MTGNSVAAAMPELALIFASQSGASGRPLPGFLQLPLEEGLRENLHELIGQKLNPSRHQSEAGRPISTLHCRDNGSGEADAGSIIKAAAEGVAGYFNEIELVGSVGGRFDF